MSTSSPAAESSTIVRRKCSHDRTQLLFFFSGGRFLTAGRGKVSLRLHTAGLSRCGRFTCCSSARNTPTVFPPVRADASTKSASHSFSTVAITSAASSTRPSVSFRSALLPTTVMGALLPPRSRRISSRSRFTSSRDPGSSTAYTRANASLCRMLSSRMAGKEPSRLVLQHVKLLDCARVLVHEAVVEETVDERALTDPRGPEEHQPDRVGTTRQRHDLMCLTGNHRFYQAEIEKAIRLDLSQDDPLLKCKNMKKTEMLYGRHSDNNSQRDSFIVLHTSSSTQSKTNISL
ncbi:hypothetical protein FQN60_012393 [Etheostoma spectabile]|uniref:Uncharacterized protein n=1 Tax=Etheostoma spectabile TaxID=54343 RepID=A0A5J5DPY8_9PERO|nr:hypothetical protein FQN60_012393 [Etheostoma spectabile]